MNPQDLTIHHAQAHQPWTVLYSKGVQDAERFGVAHILSSHAILHAAKTVGKLASVFEALDHSGDGIDAYQLDLIETMAADLVTVGLRLGNLHGFDLATVLIDRVKEKNGVGYEAAPEEAQP